MFSWVQYICNYCISPTSRRHLPHHTFITFTSATFLPHYSHHLYIAFTCTLASLFPNLTHNPHYNHITNSSLLSSHTHMHPHTCLITVITHLCACTPAHIPPTHLPSGWAPRLYGWPWPVPRLTGQAAPRGQCPRSMALQDPGLSCTREIQRSVSRARLRLEEQVVFSQPF